MARSRASRSLAHNGERKTGHCGAEGWGPQQEVQERDLGQPRHQVHVHRWRNLGNSWHWHPDRSWRPQRGAGKTWDPAVRQITTELSTHVGAMLQREGTSDGLRRRVRSRLQGQRHVKSASVTVGTIPQEDLHLPTVACVCSSWIRARWANASVWHQCLPFIVERQRWGLDACASSSHELHGLTSRKDSRISRLGARGRAG